MTRPVRRGVLFACVATLLLLCPTPQAAGKSEAPKLPVLAPGSRTIAGPSLFTVTPTGSASKDVLWQMLDGALHVCLTYAAVGPWFDVGFETYDGSEIYENLVTSGPVTTVCHASVDAILFKCYGEGETCSISWRVDQMETLYP